MAVEIKGTQVITDARGLANITNLKTVNSQSLLGQGDIEAGAVGSSLIYTKNQLIHTIRNPNIYSTGTNDQFGLNSLAISGRRIIVGAQGEDRPNLSAVGVAYIFDADTGQLLHTLANPVTDASAQFDQFGIAVAISERYAVVTANYDTPQTGSGRAYIYSVDTGQLLHVLTNPNVYSTTQLDNFYVSAAIDGDLVLVSATGEDWPGAENSGIVYVFDANSGQFLRGFRSPSPGFTEQFGWAMAISGTRAVIGSRDAGNSNSGRAYIYDVSTGEHLHTLTNPNVYGSTSEDRFGYAVAISGDIVVVGANGEDAEGILNTGKVYIFDAETGVLQHILASPNNGANGAFDAFGVSVSVSGDRILVGASGVDFNFGRAYIYDAVTGSLLDSLDNPNDFSSTINDSFGQTVAISGDRAVIAAPNESDASGSSSGTVYVFALDDIWNLNSVESIRLANGSQIDSKNALFDTALSAGALVHSLKNPNAFDTPSGDSFGFSVSISGNRAIVGAYREDSPGLVDQGQAYIFDVTTGQLIHSLANPNVYDTGTFDGFGFSVSISGNRAIVGAPGEAATGYAYIFDVSTGGLLQILRNPNTFSTDIDGEDRFGDQVAISGNRAIVGVYREDESGQSSSGRAYVFDVNTGQLLWSLANPNAYSTAAGDWFGHSVDISGNYAIVGAFREDVANYIESGWVYIYDLTLGQVLHSLINPNPVGTEGADFFGWSVAISGNRAIIGAYAEDDPGQDASGKAYIYDVTTGQRLHTLNNPNRYSTAADDYFGHKVDISGNRAIVSAVREDDIGGTDSGKAYIFDVETGSFLYTLDNPNAFSTSTNDQFGNSVAISGNYAIVGVDAEDDPSGNFSGYAYIFSVADQSQLEKLLTVVGYYSK